MVLFVLIAASGWAGPVAAADRRVALVIGNGAYDQAPVPSARASADVIARALRSVGVEVIRSDNLDQQGMLAALERFRRSLSGADLGLFYYSGLTLSVGNRGFLLPVGARLASVRDVELDGVDVNKALAAMQGAGRPLVALFDSSGKHPLIDRLAGTGAEGEQTVLASLPVPAASGKSLVVFSHRPDAEPGSVGGGASNFATALAAAITRPGQSLRDGMADVARKVGEASRGNQHPWQRDELASETNLVLLSEDWRGNPAATATELPPVAEKAPTPTPAPTSTPTPAPTPAPAQTAVPAPAKVVEEPPREREPALEQMNDMRQVSRDLNLRARPSNQAEVLGILRGGSMVHVIGRPRGSLGWFQVEQDGRTGFVTGSYLGAPEASQQPVRQGASSTWAPSPPTMAIDTSLDSAQTGQELAPAAPPVSSADPYIFTDEVHVTAASPPYRQPRIQPDESSGVTADISQEPYRSAVAAARDAAQAAGGGPSSRAAEGHAMAEQAEQQAGSARQAAARAAPYSYGNGDDYRGQWAGQLKDGVGVYRFASGQVYEGEWRNNEMAGVAVISFANGDRYAGTVSRGAPDGVGVFRFANGQIYAGEVRSGRLDGLGELHYGNGDVFRGQVANGQAQGNGELRRRDGIRHLGRFQNGVQNGPGAISNSETAPLLPGIWRGATRLPVGSGQYD